VCPGPLPLHGAGMEDTPTEPEHVTRISPEAITVLADLIETWQRENGMIGVRVWSDLHGVLAELRDLTPGTDFRLGLDEL
jgi:hypothetical protein